MSETHRQYDSGYRNGRDFQPGRQRQMSRPMREDDERESYRDPSRNPGNDWDDERERRRYELSDRSGARGEDDFGRYDGDGNPGRYGSGGFRETGRSAFDRDLDSGRVQYEPEAFGRTGEYETADRWHGRGSEVQRFGDTQRSGTNWQGQSHAGKGPKNYKRSDDRIQEEVNERLTDSHQIDASEITVQVKDGEVTLSGTVNSRDQKRQAEDLIERCSGVKEVVNNLRVHRQDQQNSASGQRSGSQGNPAHSGTQASASTGTKGRQSSAGE